MEHASTASASATPTHRRAALLLGAIVLLLAACGGDGDASAPVGDASDPGTEESAMDGEDTVATSEPDGADGRGGSAEPDGAIPPYDAENQRTESYGGTPEPCLFLTPALVAAVHGPFDMQQQLNGPTCAYIAAEPLLEVSLRSAPPASCDQIVDDATTLGRSVEDEAIDGRIVTWLVSDSAGNALVYDDEWCFHLRVLHTGADRGTMTRYVEAVTDALG